MDSILVKRRNKLYLPFDLLLQVGAYICGKALIILVHHGTGVRETGSWEDFIAINSVLSATNISLPPFLSWWVLIRGCVTMAHYPEYSQKNSNQHSLYHNYNVLSCWIAAIVAIRLIKSFVSLPSTYVISSAGPWGTAGPSQSHIHPSSSGTQLSDWSRSGNSFLSDPPQLPGGGWRGRGRASQPSQAKPSHVCIPPSCHYSIHPQRYEPTVRTYACFQSHRGDGTGAGIDGIKRCDLDVILLYWKAR